MIISDRLGTSYCTIKLIVLLLNVKAEEASPEELEDLEGQGRVEMLKLTQEDRATLAEIDPELISEAECLFIPDIIMSEFDCIETS